MTITEKICAQNQANVSMALMILRQVMPGENLGIGLEIYGEIMGPLMKAEEMLDKTIKEAITGVKWNDLSPEQ